MERWLPSLWESKRKASDQELVDAEEGHARAGEAGGGMRVTFKVCHFLVGTIWALGLHPGPNTRSGRKDCPSSRSSKLDIDLLSRREAEYMARGICLAGPF